VALLFRVRGEKPREIAVEILIARQTGLFVDVLLDSAFQQNPLSPEDRRFLQELVYGTVRWELTLDWLIDRKTSDKTRKPLVQNLLRLALYQMFWLDRIPSYAAVNESVEICKRRGFVPQAKFINAVLRGYGREADATRKLLEEFRATDLSRGYSHPEWLCRRWVEQWNRADAARLLEWNNTPAPTFARVNTLKTSAEDLRHRWENEGVNFEGARFDWIPESLVFRLRSHPPIAQLGSFQEGLFYVQDPSTLLAAHLLAPKPGETILDLCAAPGGKTTYMAQLIRNEGRIVALDHDAARLKLLAENCARLGATCVTTEPATATYDRVLADVPCSNTGVMRRRVELRWRIRPEEIALLAATQLQILQSAANQTRPDGILVYSTCSLEREENQSVVRAFLGANTGFKLETERELTPFRDGVDGAYCASFIRRG
jgi:16S rRNA (cytosine967-C5)-methyltransferase